MLLRANIVLCWKMSFLGVHEFQAQQSRDFTTWKWMSSEKRRAILCPVFCFLIWQSWVFVIYERGSNDSSIHSVVQISGVEEAWISDVCSGILLLLTIYYSLFLVSFLTIPGRNHLNSLQGVRYCYIHSYSIIMLLSYFQLRPTFGFASLTPVEISVISTQISCSGLLVFHHLGMSPLFNHLVTVFIVITFLAYLFYHEYHYITICTVVLCFLIIGFCTTTQEHEFYRWYRLSCLRAIADVEEESFVYDISYALREVNSILEQLTAPSRLETGKEVRTQRTLGCRSTSSDYHPTLRKTFCYANEKFSKAMLLSALPSELQVKGGLMESTVDYRGVCHKIFSIYEFEMGSALPLYYYSTMTKDCSVYAPPEVLELVLFLLTCDVRVLALDGASEDGGGGSALRKIVTSVSYKIVGSEEDNVCDILISKSFISIPSQSASNSCFGRHLHASSQHQTFSSRKSIFDISSFFPISYWQAYIEPFITDEKNSFGLDRDYEHSWPDRSYPHLADRIARKFLRSSVAELAPDFKSGLLTQKYRLRLPRGRKSCPSLAEQCEGPQSDSHNHHQFDGLSASRAAQTWLIIDSPRVSDRRRIDLKTRLASIRLPHLVVGNSALSSVRGKFQALVVHESWIKAGVNADTIDALSKISSALVVVAESSTTSSSDFQLNSGLLRDWSFLIVVDVLPVGYNKSTVFNSIVKISMALPPRVWTTDHLDGDMIGGHDLSMQLLGPAASQSCLSQTPSQYSASSHHIMAKRWQVLLTRFSENILKLISCEKFLSESTIEESKFEIKAKVDVCRSRIHLVQYDKEFGDHDDRPYRFSPPVLDPAISLLSPNCTAPPMELDPTAKRARDVVESFFPLLNSLRGYLTSANLAAMISVLDAFDEWPKDIGASVRGLWTWLVTLKDVLVILYKCDSGGRFVLSVVSRSTATPIRLDEVDIKSELPDSESSEEFVRETEASMLDQVHFISLTEYYLFFVVLI